MAVAGREPVDDQGGHPAAQQRPAQGDQVRRAERAVAGRRVVGRAGLAADAPRQQDEEDGEVADPGQQSGPAHATDDDQRREQHGLAGGRGRELTPDAHTERRHRMHPLTEWHDNGAREVHPRPSPIESSAGQAGVVSRAYTSPERPCGRIRSSSRSRPAASTHWSAANRRVSTGE